MVSEVVLSRSQLMICSNRASLLRSRDSPKWILLMNQALLRYIMRRAGHSVIKILRSFRAHSIWRVSKRESRLHFVCTWSRLPNLFRYWLLSRTAHRMQRALISHKFISRVVLSGARVISSGIRVEFLVNRDFFRVFAKGRRCGVEARPRHSHLILIQYLSNSLRFCHRMFYWRFSNQFILGIIEARSRVCFNLGRLSFSTDSHLFGITSEIIYSLVESRPRLRKTLPGLGYVIRIANWIIPLWGFIVE